MKNTVFDILIDFDKSSGSYLYDQKTGKKYLDCFGLFSSLPIGYNHPVFDPSFEKKVAKISKVRMANNLFQTEEMADFVTAFGKYAFSPYLHFSCTGSLAVESGIKCAMEYAKVENPKVIALKQSFHGINCWGFVTDRHMGTAARLENFPMNDWENLSLEEVKGKLKSGSRGDVAALVVEPVQCTSGDIYLDGEELREIRELCREKDVCFVLDEIQTGFGTTGKMWYYEHLEIVPDVLVFGKKSQLCGIVASPKYSECMTSPFRKLEVTFDGELIDALRATYILKAYEEGDLIRRAFSNGIVFRDFLHGKVENFRGMGHLLAFDFADRSTRDQFVNACFDKNLLINKAGDKTVRMRPNLAMTQAEIEHFLNLLDEILKSF